MNEKVAILRDDLVAFRPRWRAGAALRFCKSQPVGVVSAIVIAIFAVIAVFGPWIAPYDPSETVRGARLLSPSTDHPFGTDERGRDTFSRVVVGSRVSLEVGLVAVAIGVVGGSIAGMASAFIGGWTDLGFQRLMDAVLSLPALVLAISLAGVIGPGVTTAMVAIGIVILPSANRVVRASTLSVTETAYIEAARALGVTNSRILWRHVLPNVMAPIIVLASIVMGFAIVVEASLSFLGLGAPITTSSWGQLLNTGRPFMEDAPWLIVAPGAAITLLVLAFNLLGDALRDFLDPSLRQR